TLPRHVQRPEVPNDVLPLAEIYFPPNSNQLQVTNYNLKRLTMFELNRLLDKLKQLEYNLAVTQLDDPLRVGASPINMKGIFSEGFVDFSKASLTHPTFSGIIVPSFGIFVPDYSSIERFILVPETTTNVSVGQNFITLPYTSRPFLAQLQANRAVTINQYMVFTRIPVITADPPSRTFYEKVIIKESTATHITTVHHTIHTTNPALIGHRRTSDRILSEWFEEKLLKKEAMTFIPDCTLTVYGTDFYPNQDNLAVYFDGVQLPANPINNTPQGTAPGTVKSKSDGTLAFIINIPGNRFYTGWKKIELKNQYQKAETSFYATGTRELYEKIRHVKIRRDITIYVAAPPPDPRPADPCAQSFFVPESCFITGVGLFFRKKDNNIPIRVSLRPLLDSGLPSQEILAQKTVQPSEIVVSQNSSAETVVLFPEPVFVEGKKMYCIVLDTDSNNYEIFVAEMGQTDLLTGAPISKQPYLEGNFFSSSDAFSWTVHQTTDMKFRVYRAEFTTSSGTVITNNVSTQFTSLLTNFDTHIPDGTSLTLYYSINNGTTWNPITNLNATELNTVGTQIRFRIDFATTNRLLTPRILKNMEAITFLPNTSATYISRAITVPANSNNLELWVDIFRPSATLCNGSVSYSRDGGNSWIPLTYNQQEVTSPALNWERRRYTATLPANTTAIQIRVDLQTTNVLYQPACSNLIAIFR
ncbi:DUF4815 domain-containing protein, partial [Candidatus Caldatribacterium sp.]|uniref:DUF4815 domain-containing protein n=1 Tax=Candidatus Caldatribacterium sp. TaxID=2282143 RepID=UPI003844B076|nr:DUF4815 domain-containing protein [Candidatus Caldatribacterium sp.]